ncbi:MAG: hypothetical protein LH618_12815, partial [Saprospiraceae bacterium]|nr:hypothetical protein [Saprospiraceae bacterium]
CGTYGDGDFFGCPGLYEHRDLYSAIQLHCLPHWQLWFHYRCKELINNQSEEVENMSSSTSSLTKNNNTFL